MQVSVASCWMHSSPCSVIPPVPPAHCSLWACPNLSLGLLAACSDSTVLDLWPGRSGPFSTWNLQRSFGTMVNPAPGSSLVGVPATMQVGAWPGASQWATMQLLVLSWHACMQRTRQEQ